MDYDFDDQKYSFTKNSKIKTSTATLIAKPLKDPKINITHNGGSNNLAVKSLETFKKENKGTEQQGESSELDDEEYYTDEDYGVILRATDVPMKHTTTEESTLSTTLSSISTLQELSTDTPPKIDENTVILTENFYLPKSSKENIDPETEEYVEYIEIEEDEQSDKSSIKDGQNSLQENAEKSKENDNGVDKNDPAPTSDYEAEDQADLKERNSNLILGEAVVSVVTSKTVVNGSVMNKKLTKMVKEQEREEVGFT